MSNAMTKSEEAWFAVEKRALTGNKNAVLGVVSALRTYRQACKCLLEARYSDGAVLQPDVMKLESEIEALDDIIQVD